MGHCASSRQASVLFQEAKCEGPCSFSASICPNPAYVARLAPRRCSSGPMTMRPRKVQTLWRRSVRAATVCSALLCRTLLGTRRRAHQCGILSYGRALDRACCMVAPSTHCSSTLYDQYPCEHVAVHLLVSQLACKGRWAKFALVPPGRLVPPTGTFQAVLGLPKGY